jgi:lysophospholipase L1-like esterase
MRALFTGDSITDSGRVTDPSGHLGAGYVRRIAEIVRQAGSDLEVVNTGVSSDRTVDLLRRWSADVTDHAANILTILIGINDMLRRYDDNTRSTTVEFRNSYSALLERARGEHEVTELVVMEPFFVPLAEEQQHWLADDLELKIAVVRELAEQYGAHLIRLSDDFRSRTELAGARSVVIDGVHPTAEGHELIARAWLSEMFEPIDHGV